MRAGHELAGRTCAAVEVSLAAAKMDSNYDSVQYKILKEYSTQPIPRTSRPTLSSPHMWFLSVLLRRLLRGEGGRLAGRPPEDGAEEGAGGRGCCEREPVFARFADSSKQLRSRRRRGQGSRTLVALLHSFMG